MELQLTAAYGVRFVNSIALQSGYDIITPAQQQEQERTRIRKKLFLETLEQLYGNITLAAAKTDIHRSAVYEWIHSDPEFKRKVNEACNTRVNIVEDRFFALGMAGQGNAHVLMFILKHKHPAYKRQRKGSSRIDIYHHTERTGKDSKSVLNRTLEDLIDQEEKRAGKERS